MTCKLLPNHRAYLVISSLTFIGLSAIIATFSQPHLSRAQTSEQDCQDTICWLQQSDGLASSLTDLTPPNLLAPPTPTPSRAPASTGGVKYVTYDVATRGNVTADLNNFKNQAQQTYDDNRGWKQLGITFNPVSSGGHFTLVLATAEQLPLFSPGCSSDYSCRVGRYVIINQDRWLGATPSWNTAGGSLRDYRHMVINHETGHWLGHGHANCPATGQPAAVMQQQSINLQGCTFNPWPLSSELRSSTLGI